MYEDDVTVFVEHVETMPRPLVFDAFDRFTEAIEAAYPGTGASADRLRADDTVPTDLSILPQRSSAGRSYAGPVLGGDEAATTRSYEASAGATARFDLQARDYAETDPAAMLEHGDDGIVVDPRRGVRRDLVLEHTGGDDASGVVVDLIGDTVYALLEPHLVDYGRDEREGQRTYTFRRRTHERIPDL